MLYGEDPVAAFWWQRIGSECLFSFHVADEVAGWVMCLYFRHRREPAFRCAICAVRKENGLSPLQCVRDDGQVAVSVVVFV